MLRTRGLAVAVLVSLTTVGCLKPVDGSSGGGSSQAGGGSVAMGGGQGGQGGGSVTTDGPIALSLQPAFLTVPLGSAAHFQVFATQTDGTLTDVTSTATVTAEPASVVELTAGTIKGVAAGNAKLTAKLGKLEATGGVDVPQSPLASIALDPADAALGLGETRRLTVIGTLADDSKVDLTQAATYTSSSGAVSVDATGLVKALVAGEATVTAKVNNLEGTAHFMVRPAKLTSLAISPGMPTVAIGGTIALHATGTYDDGSTADVTASTTWSSSNPAATITMSGVATGVSAGTAVITGTFSGISGVVNLVVRMATLTAIMVNPTGATMQPGSVRAFTAQGRYSDGNTADVTTQVQWSSSAPTIAAVSNAAGHQGEVSSLTPGSADIIARLSNVQGQATLTVTPAMLVSLAIHPATVSVRPGGTVQLSVEGTYSDNSKIDLTTQATWSSSDPGVATVGNLGQGGLVSGLMTGTATVKAVVGTVNTTVPVTVARQNPDSIEIAPSNVTIQSGDSISLRAMAHYADGAQEDVSELATWTATPPAVATVSNMAGSKGRVHGVTNGMATIEAVLGTLHAQTTVTVSAPTLTALSIYPGTLRVPQGIYSGISAHATYSDGSGGDVTAQAMWTSSAPTVARVQVYQMYYAYVEAVAPGTATLTASFMGKTATLTVTITNATLISMQVSPQAAPLALGATLNVAASGLYSDQTTQNLTYTATWTSSNPAVASVGQDMLGYTVVTALSPGTATITANYGGVNGTTTVTVSQATLQTIQVTPFSPRLPHGFDTYMRATGIYSDNTTEELTYRVSWSSSAPSVANVSQYGELQPLTAGTANISANYMGVTGTSAVTVTSANLTSIAVTPNTSTVAIGMEQPFAANGSFSDGTTMDVTPYVTWLSTNRQVADVANAWPYQGSAKGLGAGMVTITAVRGAVTGTATLTVH